MDRGGLTDDPGCPKQLKKTRDLAWRWEKEGWIDTLSIEAPASKSSRRDEAVPCLTVVETHAEPSIECTEMGFSDFPPAKRYSKPLS